MRRPVLLPAVLAFALALTAQSAPAQAVNKPSKTPPIPSAVAVAEKVDSYYNTLRSLSAHFSETYRGPGTDRTETGILTLSRPGRMRWDYDTPAGKLFVIDGKDAWFYEPDAGEVQRMPVKKLDDLRSPLRFLLGKTHLAKELDGLSIAEINGKLRLQGVPKFASGEGPAQVTALTLEVEPSGEIDRIESTSADGTDIAITLSEQQPNASVAADRFHFAPPPGVRVVDGAGVF